MKLGHDANRRCALWKDRSLVSCCALWKRFIVSHEVRLKYINILSLHIMELKFKTTKNIVSFFQGMGGWGWKAPVSELETRKACQFRLYRTLGNLTLDGDHDHAFASRLLLHPSSVRVVIYTHIHTYILNVQNHAQRILHETEE